MFCDNQIFKVSGDKIGYLKEVLSLVDNMSGTKVRAYKFDDNKMELFWSYNSVEDSFKTPDNMTVSDMFPFIENFLKQVEYGDMDEYSDGTYKRGWCVEYDNYPDRRSDFNFYKIITIRPMSTYYSK